MENKGERADINLTDLDRLFFKGLKGERLAHRDVTHL